ncbi:hypothetical protein RND71_007213 [Anisodus tanguticus]|uniref:Uncharacterized protein n=1 Tax=Anisodus tanguticus TaxID=243964 RepID=A0AAE1VSW5_9SOLA|nr:hypothetical protein RND71_007213 [Anisodus tanguticus]
MNLIQSLLIHTVQQLARATTSKRQFNLEDGGLVAYANPEPHCESQKDVLQSSNHTMTNHSWEGAENSLATFTFIERLLLLFSQQKAAIVAQNKSTWRKMKARRKSEPIS